MTGYIFLVAEKATANKSIATIGAGQCNISYVQASAAVQARRSMDSLSLQILEHYQHLWTTAQPLNKHDDK